MIEFYAHLVFELKIKREVRCMDNILRANVDKNACIGCGICVDICPGVFALDPQGMADPMMSIINPALNNKTQIAADACPTGAIRLF